MPSILDNTSLRTIAPRRYGFMESTYGPEFTPAAKTYSALSVGCPNCGKPEGAYCPSDRFCRERMAEALRRARAGELDVVGQDTVLVDENDTEAVLRACRACGTQRTRKGGNPIACSEAHQCRARTNHGIRCPRQRQVGKLQCSSHSFNTAPRLRRPGDQRQVSDVVPSL